MQIQSLRGLGCNFCAFAGQVAVAGGHAVEGEHFAAAAGRFRFRAEIKLDRFPGVAALRLQPQTRRRLVTAMHHAVFATRIARDAVHDAVFVPVDFSSSSA